MGVYAPVQIVRDAREHGVELRPVCVNHSTWDNALERRGDGALALRLGFRQIKGFRAEDAGWIVAARGNGYRDPESLWLRAGLAPGVLERLAEADAFSGVGLTRRDALWAVRAIRAPKPLPLFANPLDGEGLSEPQVTLPAMHLGEEVVEDYVALRLSLRAHPMELLRPTIAGLTPHDQLATAPIKRTTVCGLVITRQRPGTASGVIFLTLEDETGVSNVVVWPKVYEKFRRIVIGGRLGYVLFYQRELLTQFTNDIPFWGVFAINQGGMASHGGVIGGVAGCAVFAWRQKFPFAHMLDLMAFGGPIGLLFGRIANFINGELVGRACSADFPLAVKFPQAMMDWLPRRLDDGTVTPGDPRLNDLFNGIHAHEGWLVPQTNAGVIQFAIEKVQQGDPAMVAIVEPLLTPRYPSQLFAGLTEGVIVFAVMLVLYRRPVKPGLLGGAFCICYAVMRVVNEFFRMPDSHLMPDGVMPAITRGQWLSFGLFVLGIVIVTMSIRSKQDKLGGWRGGQHKLVTHAEG